MSVQPQQPIITRIANGSTTEFEITFDLHDEKALVVTVNNEIPEVGSFSVRDNKVIFSVAPTDGSIVTLYRDSELNRLTDYKNYDGSFNANTINWDLDKLWYVLQEQNLVDAKILARIKEEVEWRRTHDFNYDELAQVREKQLFDALKGYTDTLLASTNPGVFQGVIAGVVFAQDGKSVQTHLKEIADKFAEERQYLEEQLNTKAEASDVYPKSQTYTQVEVNNLVDPKADQIYVDDALAAINTDASKQYATLEAANADIANINVGRVVFISDSMNGGYWYKALPESTALTKSPFDPLSQGRKYTNETMDKASLALNDSDMLLTPSGRSLSYANGSAVGSGVTANGVASGIEIQTNSSTSSVVLSTPLSLKLNTPCVITHKFKFTGITSAQVMCGLTFNTGANLRNVNIRNDGTIYTTDTASTTKIVIASTLNQAKFNANEEVECTYFWSGSVLELQVKTVNGTTSKYQISELSNLESAIQINQRGIGTSLQYSPLLVKKRDIELVKSVSSLSSSVEKSSSLMGAKQDFAYTVAEGIANSNGTTPTGATLTLNSSDLIFDVITSSARNVIFSTNQVIEDKTHQEVELNFEITALIGASARYVGLSIGDGVSRRHYVWQGTGGVIEYDDAETVLSTIASTATSRAYDLNNACKIKLIREADSSATLKLYVNNVIVASLQISNVPTGKVYICARSAPIVTYKFTALTTSGYNSAVINALKAVPQGTYVQLVNQISVPDAQAANASGGFTCTGAQQIGSTGKWAGCWVVGNHGQVYEGSTVYNPSIVLLSPDRTRKLQEWDMSVIEGIQSIQGVAWDSSDDTIWFVDKTNRVVRHIDFTGTLLPDSIAAPVDYTRVNGIAYNPTLDAMYVQNEGVKQIKLISCADGTTVLGTWGSLTASADQFHYDANKNWLMYSFGDNGIDGQLHVMDLTHDKVLSIITLEGSQSIEGICIANNGNLVAFNDGGYHTTANPPLNISCEYKINFDF